jgi:hypothetical protein
LHACLPVDGFSVSQSPLIAAIKFLTYEQLSRKISHHLIDNGGDGQLTPLLRLSAGAGAALLAACSLPTPLCSCLPAAWVAIVRQQRHPLAPLPAASGKHCWKKQCFETCSFVPPCPPFDILLTDCCAAAGVVGMSATYPLDMVRGRITVQEAGNMQYKGLWHATGCIIRCGAKPGWTV